MADIGTEVSIKIRSAIKAKLMELGAFVDDELPDYIMVMVANKRSKQQMDVDLQLFLGTNTANFTGWLHTVLQKLEEVTIANNLALSQRKSDANKHAESVEPSSRSKLSTISTDGEGHKHKHEKKRKSSEGSNKKSLKESKAAGKTSSGKKLIKSSDLKVSENKVRIVDSANTASSNNSSSKVKGYHETNLDSGSKSVDVRTISDSNTISSSEKGIDQLQSFSPIKKMTLVSQVPSVTKDGDSVQKPSLMSSPIVPSDEDDEDFLNIKDDAEAMELLDAELSEDNQKLAPKITISPQSSIAASNGKLSSNPLVLPKTVPDTDVDELEEQRANLLRDLQLLDKPSKSSSEKRSTLVDRLGSKLPTTSVLDRLGAKIDARPRLHIIDPNELDIVRPTPREVELTKQKVADRLGKRSIADKESSQITVTGAKKSVFANALHEEVSSDRRPGSSSERRNKEMDKDKKVEEFESLKLNIRDRLGERLTAGTSGKRTVSVVHNDRKHSSQTELSRPRIMDRLGKKVDPDCPTEKTTALRDSGASKPRVADRLGKKVDLEPPTLPRDVEAIKLSVMERLGKRHVSGSDAERKGQGEREDRVPRSSQIISIKEAVKGELQHGSLLKRQADERSDDMQEIPRKRPLLSSRVVAVKRDTVSKATKDATEEYDPTNPAVASVIRVKPRPKVPASMQAPKNLLLKAMAEAQKSVTTAAVRQESQRLESLYTRKYRDSGQSMEKINITVANPPKQSFKEESEESAGEEAEDGEEEERYAHESEVTKAGKVEQNEAENSTRRGRQKIVDELPTEGKPVENDDQMPIDGTKDKGSDPKSIEDDDDDDDDVIFEEIFDDDMNEEDLNEMNVSNGDSNIGNVSPINNDEIISETTEYVPTKIDNSSGRQHRMVRTASPQFVVTLDGLDPNIFNPRKRTVDASESHEQEEESGVTSPVPGLDSDTDDRVKKEEERNEQNASPVVYKKPKLAPVVVEPVKTVSLERCKYWPACSKGDLCEFLHPSTPCKMFPSCKFGDRCLYVHPNCKFDISCTRRECPYSHTGVRSSTLQAQSLPTGKSRSHSQPLCKFYPKCSNVNCSFLHPKPCRFGRACTNRDCSFFHEEIPTAEKLKWVNSNRF